MRTTFKELRRYLYYKSYEAAHRTVIQMQEDLVQRLSNETDPNVRKLIKEIIGDASL